MVTRSFIDLVWNQTKPMTPPLGLILLMPIYIVWNLQMPVQRRFAVIGIFGLGALVTITGIVRLRSFILAWRSPSNQTSKIRSKSYEPYYEH